MFLSSRQRDNVMDATVGSVEPAAIWMTFQRSDVRFSLCSMRAKRRSEKKKRKIRAMTSTRAWMRFDKKYNVYRKKWKR